MADAAPGIVLVTGASGFLGRAVCEAWRGRGRYIRAFARAGGGPLPAVDDVVPLADPFDTAVLARAMAGVDTVVHLAARAHQLADRAAEPLAEYRRVNVEWTRAVAEAARAAGVRRLVFASSVKAVGERTDTPWTEAVTPRPVDPYGVSKLEAESLLRAMAVPGSFDVPILRLPLLYGPGLKANMLRLFEAVARRRPLPLALVRNRRSFAYVGNVIAAMDAVIAAGPAGSATFFVSDGRDLSTPELVRLIAAALGVESLLLPVPPALLRAAGRAGDLLTRVGPFPLTSAAVDRLVGSLAVDVSLLRATTGWRPPCTVEEGLAATATWYRQWEDGSR